MLDPVHAKLLNSEFVARGGVFRVPGHRYRRVLLDAVSNHARLEDLLRLALKAEKPPMTGDVSFHTRIDVPPGKGVVADRLKLDGEFEINSARFSELDLQNKVATLSRRGRGQTEAGKLGQRGFGLRRQVRAGGWPYDFFKSDVRGAGSFRSSRRNVRPAQSTN